MAPVFIGPNIVERFGDCVGSVNHEKSDYTIFVKEAYKLQY